jgi:CDP-diacylglycerol--glycerol-3-phosphate 3-phosphatidyltransferase/cardiolipin synthase
VSDEIRPRDLISVPGLLTLSRVGFAVAFPFVAHRPLVALAVLVAAALSDMLDGWYARRFNRCSVMGAVLDPITDKLFAVSVVVSLIVVGRLQLVWAALLFIRELVELPLTAWLALDARSKRVHADELHANRLGKATTTLQFAAVAALLLDHRTIFFVALTATAVLGVVSASSYYRQFKRAMRVHRERHSSIAPS